MPLLCARLKGGHHRHAERLLFRKQLSVAFTKRSAVIRETRIIAPPGPEFTGCVSCVIPHVQCIGSDIRHCEDARRNLTICGRGIQDRDLIERRRKSQNRAFRKEQHVVLMPIGVPDQCAKRIEPAKSSCVFVR